MFALLFVLWFAAEVFVVIEVAGAIGVLATIALLVVSWPLGGWALRAQGRAAWRRASAALAAGRSPGPEVLDGVLILLGGLLLIVPGFVSDALGALALVPATRSLLRDQLARHVQHRFVRRAARFAQRGQPYDVEGTATDAERAQLWP